MPGAARSTAPASSDRPSAGPRWRRRPAAGPKRRAAATGTDRRGAPATGTVPSARRRELTSTSGVNSGWIATPSSAATGTSSATISEIALKGRISPPCSRHRPHTAYTARARASSSSSSSRRLLPIPASPATSSSGTRCAGSRASSESMASRPVLTSSSRPTIRSLESSPVHRFHHRSRIVIDRPGRPHRDGYLRSDLRYLRCTSEAPSTSRSGANPMTVGVVRLHHRRYGPRPRRLGVRPHRRPGHRRRGLPGGRVG